MSFFFLAAYSPALSPSRSQKHAYFPLRALDLEESKAIGFTYKAMGAALWAVRCQSFEQAISAIVREAGDADTNAIVAGAVLGAKLGMSAIPARWIDAMPHREWLLLQVDELIHQMLQQ